MPWLPAVTRLLVVLVVVAARATLTRFVTLADRSMLHVGCTLPGHERPTVDPDLVLHPQPAEPPASHTANSQFSMRGCRITRSQLDRIWRLAVEDFGDSGHQAFTAKRKAGEVETEITSESIDGLLAGVQKSTLPGDPNRLDNLSMRVSARYPDEDQSISINIDCGYQWYSPRNVRVSVSGMDPGWTRGRQRACEIFCRRFRLRGGLGGVQPPLGFTGRFCPWSLCSTPHLLSQ
jgi:hypothetical protein